MRTISFLIIFSIITGYTLLSFAQNESMANDSIPTVVAQYDIDSTEIIESEVVDSAYHHVMDSLLRADYLFVSNGLMHVCCRMLYAEASYVFLRDVPAFNELV